LEKLNLELWRSNRKEKAKVWSTIVSTSCRSTPFSQSALESVRMVTLTMNVAPFVWFLSVFQVNFVETESGQSPSKAKSRQRSGVEE